LGALPIAGLALLIWLLSGVYIVGPDEVGVVQTFGKYSRAAQSGLNYHFPYPIEKVSTPKVTEVKRVEIGFRTVGKNQYQTIERESLMLTGDENILQTAINVSQVRVDQEGMAPTRRRNKRRHAEVESTLEQTTSTTQPIVPHMTSSTSQLMKDDHKRAEQWEEQTKQDRFEECQVRDDQEEDIHNDQGETCQLRDDLEARSREEKTRDRGEECHVRDDQEEGIHNDQGELCQVRDDLEARSREEKTQGRIEERHVRDDQEEAIHKDQEEICQVRDDPEARS
jgi:hypothetical protein